MKVDFSAFQDTTVEWAARPPRAVRATPLTRTIYCLALLAFALPALAQGASWIAPATGRRPEPALASWVLFLISAAMAYRAYGVVSYPDTLDARPPYLVGWVMRWTGWTIMLGGIAGLIGLLLATPLSLLLFSGAASPRMVWLATVLAGCGWLGCVLFEISRWAGHRVTPRPGAATAGQRIRSAVML